MRIELEGVDFPVYRVAPGELYHSKKASQWCQLPYPNHPKGCQNYNHRWNCPPKGPYVTEVLDLTKYIYFTHSEFDLAGHMAKLKAKHPNWTERQLRCVLYWQRKSVSQMKRRALIVARRLRCNFVTFTPEALGINVYATCKKAGLKLEPIKTLKLCRHVAILGQQL